MVLTQTHDLIREISSVLTNGCVYSRVTVCTDVVYRLVVLRTRGGGARSYSNGGCGESRTARVCIGKTFDSAVFATNSIHLGQKLVTRLAGLLVDRALITIYTSISNTVICPINSTSGDTGGCNARSVAWANTGQGAALFKLIGFDGLFADRLAGGGEGFGG